MIEVREISVRLGDRDYTIREAGFVIAKPWKKRLIDEIKPLFDRLSNAPDMTFEKPSDLFQLVPLMELVFIEGIETIFDLLLDYAPALKAEREYIADNATDRQIFAAFREVVLLADPFGLVQQLNRRFGREPTGT